MGADPQGDWRRLLEGHLARLGRDDIGVGDVQQADATHLMVEFIKGGMRRTATLAVDDLQDGDRARAALTSAMLSISKAVERQHMADAGKPVEQV
ncbi:MAG TPA: hypothetical protein VFW08_01950 [bacterium]|nr:hypothetical protein [bacterium]